MTGMPAAEANIDATSLPMARRTGPPWYGLGIGDLILVMLAIGIGQTASSGIIGDPGLGWHLRTPDVVLSDGWPTSDPFSGPKNGSYWLANQWLGDMPLWLGWKAAGLNGVVAVTIGLLLLAYRLLYDFLRDDGLGWPAAALWTYAAAIASFNAWMARPNLISLLFVALLARVLSQYHESRIGPRKLVWLLPMFMIWANCHGGFIVGLVMIAVAAAVELAVGLFHPDDNERFAAILRFRLLVRTAGGCVLATFINPYGWKIYGWVFSLLGNNYFMNLNAEWLSPDFHAAGSIRIAAFIIMLPALLALSRYRPQLILLALSLLWLYLALKSQRYIPIWILVVTPLLARAGAQIDWLNTRIAKHGQEDFFHVRSGGWIGLVIIWAGLAVWAVKGPSLDHNAAIYPSNGLRELIRLRQPGETVLNHPDFGGFLTWHAWPELLVWIDDRNEVHGQEWYEDFFELEKTAPGWEERLKERGIRWIAIHPERPLDFRLKERPALWEQVYRDAVIVVYHRTTP